MAEVPSSIMSLLNDRWEASRYIRWVPLASVTKVDFSEMRGLVIGNPASVVGFGGPSRGRGVAVGRDVSLT